MIEKLDILENSHRRCLGLSELDSSWKEIKARGRRFYHDGTHLRKEIISKDFEYFECDLYEPIPEKITAAVIKGFDRRGISFWYLWNRVLIENASSKNIYYEEDTDNIKKWLKKWVKETTESDLEELRDFAKLERSECHYKEGDVFAFRNSRRSWGFGRIICDMRKKETSKELLKSRNSRLKKLMRNTLQVQIYHYLSPTPDIDIELLKGENTLPSMSVYPGDFDRGDYRIIGHLPLEDSETMPVESFGLMVSPQNQNCYLLYGNRYIEDTKLPTGIYESFSNEAVRFTMKFNEKMLKSCIATKSNLPYWKESPFYKKKDLRNPRNAQARALILKHFGLEDNI